MLASLAIAYMLSFLHALEMHWSVYGALGASVWLIYTFDHLMDANTIGVSVISERHQFHNRYFKQIVYLWSLTLIVSGFVLLPNLPPKTILYGVVGCAVVIVHFVFVKLLGSKLSIWIQKEFGVALVFTLGVFVGPLSYVNDLTQLILIEFVRLFFVSFFNLVMFSLFDLEIDSAQNQTSIARYLKLKGTYSLLLLIDLLFLSSLFFYHFDSSCYFYAFVLVFYNGLVFLKLKGKIMQYYRFFGDLVLIGAVVVPFL